MVQKKLPVDPSKNSWSVVESLKLPRPLPIGSGINELSEARGRNRCQNVTAVSEWMAERFATGLGGHTLDFWPDW
jgi:hypothetical protein